MFKRYWRVAATTLMVALLAALGPQQATAQGVSLLSVQSGHSTVLRTPGLERVAVGDGRIAGVVPIGTSQIVINGKAPGHTTVMVWAEGVRTSYEITVTEEQLDDLAQVLRTTLNEPGVEVLSFNHSIVVRGTVADGGHYQVINDIVTRFQPYAQRQKDVLVNAVTVMHPIAELQRSIANLPGASSIRVDPDGKGNVIVSGHVHDAVTAQAILERTRGLAGPYLASDGKLINRIATDTTSQIDVKVYVLEIDETGLSQLGVRLQSAVFDSTGAYQLSGPSFTPVEAPRVSPRGFTVGPFFRSITLAPTLDALMREGHARMLSSPDLVTTPGNEANFLVGGEIPVPYSTGLNQVSVIYKEFGVKLKVTPTLLGNGSVESKINPEVSDLDYSNGVVTNGFSIPGLKKSELSTDIITQSGESIIMGGMVRRVEQRTIDKIPLLAQLPILGKLFQSTRYQSQQSDVVFVMTPEVLTR